MIYVFYAIYANCKAKLTEKVLIVHPQHIILLECTILFFHKIHKHKQKFIKLPILLLTTQEAQWDCENIWTTWRDPTWKMKQNLKQLVRQMESYQTQSTGLLSLSYTSRLLYFTKNFIYLHGIPLTAVSLLIHKIYFQPGLVVYVYNPSTQKAEISKFKAYLSHTVNSKPT